MPLHDVSEYIPRLKLLLEQLPISIEGMAQKIDVTYGTLTFILRGKHKIQPKTLNKIKNFLAQYEGTRHDIK